MNKTAHKGGRVERMKRQEKFIDTDVFMFYNANPFGRLGGDCVVRAIATATNRRWAYIVNELTTFGLRRGYILNDPKLYKKWLAVNGWVMHKKPKKSNGKSYTGAEFCRTFKPKLCIAHINSHHIVAIVNGKILDTWDSSSHVVGNYWTKGESR